MLNEAQAHAKLAELLAVPGESECVEWKSAEDDFNFEKLGKYFSALWNEANLKGKDSSWLVLGVRNDKTVCGCRWKQQRPELDNLKQGISEHTTFSHTFMEIYEVSTPEGRVVLFQIPPAPHGIPIAWKSFWYVRNGESLVGLTIDKLDRIRSQVRNDWSGAVIPEATLNDLAPQAILKAREQYSIKHPKHAEEAKTWDNATFLNKAKVLKQGKITRAALLLLGREESGSLTGRSQLIISWIIQDSSGKPLDYQHFGIPFILAVGQVLGNIRNLTYRYLPNESLFPQEISTYDSYVIREALHNSIAHQDYTLNGKINVVEKPDELLFANAGSFLPGSVEAVVERDAPSEEYRNPCLAEAMVNLNMIDTIGSGIKKMFETQRGRFFPLPEYDLNDSSRVEVKIFGKVLNPNYTALLRERPDLDLPTVMLLDMVQKGKHISLEAAHRLRALHLVEGRYPHLFISSLVAIAIDQRAEYIRKRAFDDAHYEQLILSYLEEYSSATRDDFRALLFDKLSDVLTASQKEHKLHNLLHGLKRKGKVFNSRGRKFARWELSPETITYSSESIVNNYK
ncbi:MAG TPA: RNA-binding domain-containing protein [Candidatus Kapabacteria bacterium]|nr:RNA-binding domain-containing protein [Candidatus Kapabacteria bacterium]